ncbi:hypothetical protein ACFT0D_30940, partial [Streptomyces sp. NPDC056982]
MSDTARSTSRRALPLPPERLAPAPERHLGAGTVPGAAAVPAAKPAKKRDAFFDNAKYLAIVLVAMGHAWEPLRGDSRAAAA